MSTSNLIISCMCTMYWASTLRNFVRLNRNLPSTILSCWNVKTPGMNNSIFWVQSLIFSYKFFICSCTSLFGRVSTNLILHNYVFKSALFINKYYGWHLTVNNKYFNSRGRPTRTLFHLWFMAFVNCLRISFINIIIILLIITIFPN